MTFRILVVCAGNICRSPVAAQLLAAGLEDDIQVSSAGLDAMVGYGLDPDMAAAMRRAGIIPQPHRAKRLNSWLLEVADLVLTMDRSQRSRVLEMAPLALHRTFPLREFALACATLRDSGELSWPARSAQESRLQELTARAGGRDAVTPADSDVVIDDPYRGTLAEHDRAVLQIAEAVSAILDAVRRGGPGPRQVSLNQAAPRRAAGPRHILEDTGSPVSWSSPGRAPRRIAGPSSPS